MTPVQFAQRAAWCVVAVYVGVVSVAGVLLRDWRVDVSALSAASLPVEAAALAKQVSDSVSVSILAPSDAAAKELQAQTVLLTSASGGRISVNARAASTRLEAPLIIITNAVDDSVLVTEGDVTTAGSAPLAIARAIAVLERTQVSDIGVFGAWPGEGDRPSLAHTLTANRARLVLLERDFKSLASTLKAVLVFEPALLSASQAEVISAFHAQGGGVFFAVDPAPISDIPASSSGAVVALLAAWGIGIPNLVVLDLDAALPAQSRLPSGETIQRPQPLMFRVGDGRGVTFAGAGVLDIAPRDGISITPIAQTSERTARLDAAIAQSAPSPDITLAAPFVQKRETLIVSAVHDGHVAPMIVASDADFLKDRWYISPGADASEDRTVADNAVMFGRIVDHLLEQARGPLSDAAGPATISRLSTWRKAGETSPAVQVALAALAQAEQTHALKPNDVGAAQALMQATDAVHAARTAARAALDRWLFFLGVGLILSGPLVIGLFVMGARFFRRLRS